MDLLTLLAAKGSRPLFSTLANFPARQFTINELARVSGVPFSTAWNIVKKWERAGIVDTGRVGKAVTVRLSSGEMAKKTRDVFDAGVSPHQHAVAWLAKELSADKNVKSAFVFGSVTRGEEELDSDVDLAIFARKGFDSAALAAKAIERFRAKVIPLVFTDGREFSSFLEGKGAVKLK